MIEGTSSAPIEAMPAAARRIADSPSSRPRLRRGRLWRAIAGMLFALALAAAVVTLEFHAQSRSSSDHLRRQLGREQSKVIQLQQAVASANHEVAVADQELAAQQTLNKILLRPETKLIHFDKTTLALSGFVALDQQRAIAAIAIDSAQMAKQAAEVYWVPRNHAPVPAAQFNFDSHGRAITFVELPPFFRSVDSLIVAVNPASSAHRDLPDKPLIKASLVPSPMTR